MHVYIVIEYIQLLISQEVLSWASIYYYSIANIRGVRLTHTSPLLPQSGKKQINKGLSIECIYWRILAKYLTADYA